MADCKKCLHKKECPYPYYGLAPHKHDLTKTGSIFGSTVLEDKSTWPKNFKEDPEAPGCGGYMKPEKEEPCDFFKEKGVKN